MQVYLDACCLSRLTDDQSSARIREETGAIAWVLELIRCGSFKLIASETLLEEVRRNPFPQRQAEAERLLLLAYAVVGTSQNILQRATGLARIGYGPYDALHLASAESAGVDVLLTTDDRFIRLASRGKGQPRVSVLNPVSWMKEN